ncbi:MAG: hypothetical protein N3B16_06495, partial [Candidatus Aminicenantes bacterium]|nr:hypothetical protein [Candidatus Aminicenantes bacterium]
YYRDEQGNLKRIRSPFLWFTNAYVVYNFKISEKIRVAVDLNVENLFNIATARSYYSLKMQSNMTVSEAMVLSKNWDLNTPGINYIPDPRFLMKQDFYPPISARLGFKLSF